MPPASLLNRKLHAGSEIAGSESSLTSQIFSQRFSSKITILYEPNRFANVRLSPETSLLSAVGPSGVERLRLNRALMEEAYPGIAARTTGFRALVQWTLWGGTACIVSSGLLNFLFQWRTSLRAFRNPGKMFGRGNQKSDYMEELEAPTSWYLVGQALSLAAVAYLGKITFDMPYWLAILAFVLSFILAAVACRVTGESDTTPVGAMGQITQLTVGAIHPGSATTTLMSANVVSAPLFPKHLHFCPRLRLSFPDA